MVTPVGNKPIFAIIPTRAVSQLKGMSSIDSFTFGNQNLRPAIVELFKRRGIEIKDIYLDNPAKVRLMGMMPSFESMVAKGKTAEEIFSYLELSLFTSKQKNKLQTLNILGDKDNINAVDLRKELLAKLNKIKPFFNPTISDNSPILSDSKLIGLCMEAVDMFKDLISWRQSRPVAWIPSADQDDPILKKLKDHLINNREMDLINWAIGLAVELALSGARKDNIEAVWAGIAVLSVLPITKDHPDLPRVGEILAYTISAGDGAHWANVITATETALRLKDILSDSDKLKIKTAAKNQLYALEVAELYSEISHASALSRKVENVLGRLMGAM